MWVGVPPRWAALFVLIGFLVPLVASRIVAETGMPFVRFYSGSTVKVLALFPFGWMTAVTIYLSGVMDAFFHMGSRVNTGAFATQALAVDEDDHAESRTRNSVLMLSVLLLGFVVYGALTVGITYHRYQTLNGGVVLGEILAVVFWRIVASELALLGFE